MDEAGKKPNHSYRRKATRLLQIGDYKALHELLLSHAKEDSEWIGPLACKVGEDLYVQKDDADSQKYLLLALDADLKNPRSYYLLGKIYLRHPEVNNALSLARTCFSAALGLGETEAAEELTFLDLMEKKGISYPEAVSLKYDPERSEKVEAVEEVVSAFPALNFLPKDSKSFPSASTRSIIRKVVNAPVKDDEDVVERGFRAAIIAMDEEQETYLNNAMEQEEADFVSSHWDELHPVEQKFLEPLKHGNGKQIGGYDKVLSFFEASNYLPEALKFVIYEYRKLEENEPGLTLDMLSMIEKLWAEELEEQKESTPALEAYTSAFYDSAKLLFYSVGRSDTSEDEDLLDLVSSKQKELYGIENIPREDEKT